MTKLQNPIGIWNLFRIPTRGRACPQLLRKKRCRRASVTLHNTLKAVDPWGIEPQRSDYQANRTTKRGPTALKALFCGKLALTLHLVKFSTR